MVAACSVCQQGRRERSAGHSWEGVLKLVCVADCLLSGSRVGVRGSRWRARDELRWTGDAVELEEVAETANSSPQIQGVHQSARTDIMSRALN